MIWRTDGKSDVIDLIVISPSDEKMAICGEVLRTNPTILSLPSLCVARKSKEHLLQLMTRLRTCNSFQLSHGTE